MFSSSSHIEHIVENISNELEPPSHNLPFLCGICNKNVSKKAVFCDQCGTWIHIKCNNISSSEYKILVEEPDDKQWLCLKCTILNNASIFPFTLVTDNVLLGMSDIAMPSITDTLPSFEAVSQLTSLPNLSDYDTDENLHIRITSQYATVQEVASMELSDKDFRLFHMNIRSHSLHHDELHALLSSLNVNFQVIGLSEIKFSTETQVKSNIELPGYNFHYTPSQGSAGGVGLYVKSELKASQRNDLCISNVDFETVWIVIINPKAKNILCCCTYRHPNSEISKLIDHFHEVLGNLAKENKQIAIMGDFNIDLLNYDSHIATNEFVNMMFTHYFQPCILHPSRITDTSSTIIDNIYINSATENSVFGGNILSLISDHLPQFAILFGNTPEYKVSFASVHDYRNFNVENFLAEYTAIEKSYLTDDDIDVSKTFDTFLQASQSCR